MEIGKKILHFLFGKDPDIFDENGEVRHDLGEQMWSAWDARYRNPENDWHHHSGTQFHPESEMKKPAEEEKALPVQPVRKVA